MKLKAQKIKLAVGAAVLVVVIGVLAMAAYNAVNTPERALEQYFKAVNERDYTKMYLLISDDAKEKITRDDFITRNQNIYEGIEAGAVEISVMSVEKIDSKQQHVYYNLHMNTVAGSLDNPGNIRMKKDSLFGQYRLVWNSSVILPGLSETSRVSVSTQAAERGSIFDSSKNMLAGPGMAPSVGFVPEKINAETRDADLARVAELLGMTAEAVEKELSASWVTEDIFVPVKTLAAIDAELEAALLQVPGVMIGETEVRSYPYGEKAAHLTGYIGAITAEELEDLKDSGSYRDTSIIGKSGLEKIYDRKLRGKDGGTITVTDTSSDGIVTRRTLCESEPVSGSDVHTTIDAALQTALYDQFAGEKNAAAAMNLKTGEVLALVSTPSYNPNDMILGMTDAEWEALRNNPERPLMNRFEMAWTPGGMIQPVTGAIGLEVKTLDQEASGTSDLQNALIHADSQYFEKAGIKIGSAFSAELKDLGFEETLPFDFEMEPSKISESGTLDDDEALATAGDGQKGMAVTPLHLASIYSAFVSDGSMVKPYIGQKTTPAAEYWKDGVFSKETADILKTALIQSVENPEGRLSGAKTDGLTLAGKTGTAVQKISGDETNTEQVDWCALFNADLTQNRPVFVVAVAEDVKDRGGSGYLIPKVKAVF